MYETECSAASQCSSLKAGGEWMHQDADESTPAPVESQSRLEMLEYLLWYGVALLLLCACFRVFVRA